MGIDVAYAAPDFGEALQHLRKGDGSAGCDKRAETEDERAVAAADEPTARGECTAMAMPEWGVATARPSASRSAAPSPEPELQGLSS